MRDQGKKNREREREEEMERLRAQEHGKENEREVSIYRQEHNRFRMSLCNASMSMCNVKACVAS
mgnify:CR=1 FL=1